MPMKDPLLLFVSSSVHFLSSPTPLLSSSTFLIEDPGSFLGFLLLAVIPDSDRRSKSFFVLFVKILFVKRKTLDSRVRENGSSSEQVELASPNPTHSGLIEQQ